jgi:hypothetical protein
LRKRFYIMLVARNAEGELLKIPIPLHYAYVFIAGALIGMLTITGMAGSYTRRRNSISCARKKPPSTSNTSSWNRLPRKTSYRHSH